MADTYSPNGPGDANPIGCVASWVVNLVRPSSPAYAHAPAKAPIAEPVLARVRGIVVERAPVCQTDGTATDDGTGPVVAITLVLDDDEAASTVLDALRDGTPIRVLSAGRG